MIIHRLGQSFALTAEELEAAYRERQQEYLLMDAAAAVDRAIEDGADISDPDGIAQVAAEYFSDNHDCNCDDNSQWDQAVKYAMSH